MLFAVDEVVVAGDAVTTRDKHHAAAAENDASVRCLVIPAESILLRWQRLAEGDTFRAISKLIEVGVGMRILIAGAGTIGFNLASALSSEGQDVVVIDQKEERLASIERSIDCRTVQGNAISPLFLKKLAFAEQIS